MVLFRDDPRRELHIFSILLIGRLRFRIGTTLYMRLKTNECLIDTRYIYYTVYNMSIIHIHNNMYFDQHC